MLSAWLPFRWMVIFRRMLFIPLSRDGFAVRTRRARLRVREVYPAHELLRALHHTAPGCRIDIVSYRFGGLVCRHYVQQLAAHRRAARPESSRAAFVTIRDSEIKGDIQATTRRHKSRKLRFYE